MMSPKTFLSDGGNDNVASTIAASNFTVQEKRQLVEKFLKDDHVFQMLYETVFTSAAESVKAREAATLKTNSFG